MRYLKTNSIKNVFIKLGRLPALIFLFGYLMVIFIFSLIYCYGLSGMNFYHPTSQYEYEYFNPDANKILQDIRTEMIQDFLKYHKNNSEFNGWQMDINKLEIYSLNVKDFPKEIGFTVSIPIVKQEREGAWILSILSSNVIVSLQDKMRIDETMYLKINFEKFFNSTGIPTPDYLFPNTGGGYTRVRLPLLPLSVDLYDRIIAFGQGYRGFPSGVSGQYLRMLYFSTGVATSSTFGDIIPVSTQARFSVTVEALLAIIFIGLFLNSLAYVVGGSLKNAQCYEEKEKADNAKNQSDMQKYIW
jgi:hypothetical protein